MTKNIKKKYLHYLALIKEKERLKDNIVFNERYKAMIERELESFRETIKVIDGILENTVYKNLKEELEEKRGNN